MIGAAACVALALCAADGQGRGLLHAREPRPALAALQGVGPPVPRDRGTWYGWQTLIADATAGALALVGATPRNDAALTAASALYLLGGPAMHWSRRLLGRGFASLGRRVVFPLGLGLVFALAGGSGGGGGNAGVGRLGGAIVGAGAGGLAAAIWDATSRDEPGLARFEQEPEAPQGVVFVGGAFTVFADSTGGGPAGSLDAAFETRRWVLHANALKARTRRSFTSDVSSASLTLSYLFWEGSTTPYAGGGGGWVRETTTYSGQSAEVAGPAFVAEAGWMFLRDERWLRMSAGLQAIVPLFSADKPSMFRDSPAFPLLGLNLRLML